MVWNIILLSPKVDPENACVNLFSSSAAWTVETIYPKRKAEKEVENNRRIKGLGIIPPF